MLLDNFPFYHISFPMHYKLEKNYNLALSLSIKVQELSHITLFFLGEKLNDKEHLDYWAEFKELFDNL